MNSLIKTKKTADTLTISIPISDMQTEEIEDILAYLKARLIARKSKLTQPQADELADEVTASWWEKNKDRIHKMIADNER